MEVIQVEIKYTRPDVFSFYPFNDIHSGAVECVEKDIRAKVLECANRKNSYAIGIGDYSDCITKNDGRFNIDGLAPWVEKSNIVESQRNWLTNKKEGLLVPLAEEGKLLCLGTGNHEEDIHMKHDNDIARNICKDLNVPYAGYAYFLVVTFLRGKTERHQFIFHCWHGAGSAQTEGARLMRLVRLVNDIQADIYLMAHLHAITIHTPDRLSCSRQGRVKSRGLIAAITGSWLKTYPQPVKGQSLNPTYGEKKGYKPSRIGCPIIHIEPDKDRMAIEV